MNPAPLRKNVAVFAGACLTGSGNVRFGKYFTCKVRFVIMENSR